MSKISIYDFKFIRTLNDLINVYSKYNLEYISIAHGNFYIYEKDYNGHHTIKATFNHLSFINKLLSIGKENGNLKSSFDFNRIHSSYIYEYDSRLYEIVMDFYPDDDFHEAQIRKINNEELLKKEIDTYLNSYPNIGEILNA